MLHFSMYRYDYLYRAQRDALHMSFVFSYSFVGKNQLPLTRTEQLHFPQYILLSHLPKRYRPAHSQVLSFYSMRSSNRYASRTANYKGKGEDRKGGLRTVIRSCRFFTRARARSAQSAALAAPARPRVPPPAHS